MIFELVMIIVFRKCFGRPIRYFRDITLNDLKNPKTQIRCWNIITKRVANLEQKVRLLNQSRRRLQSKISCQDSLLNYLRDKNYLSENASEAVEVIVTK